MATKRINLSRLPLERKRAAWEWLQAERPAEAELIASNEVQQIIKAFNADVLIEINKETPVDNENEKLKDKILEILQQEPGLRAHQIASLAVERTYDVSLALRHLQRDHLVTMIDFKWSAVGGDDAASA